MYYQSIDEVIPLFQPGIFTQESAAAAGHWHLTLPNYKFWDVTKLKAFADDKLKVAKMTIFLLERAENTWGKRRKCWLPAFSPFPTVFSKVLLL